MTKYAIRLMKRATPGLYLLFLLLLSACSGLPTGGTGGTGETTPTAAVPPSQPTQPAIPTVNPNQPLNINLIVNGDAESAAGSADDSSLVAIPGWTRHGNFNVMQYQSDDSSYLSTTSPGPSNRGKNFFYGGSENGTDNTVTSATQTIDVSAAAVLLSSGKVKFVLSGWLGGYSDQNDNAVLRIQFVGATGQALGQASIGPVQGNARNSTTSLLQRSTNGVVPVGTTKIEVTLTMTKTDGSDNDGSADNLSLLFSL
jgi:hypothetical protein